MKFSRYYANPNDPDNTYTWYDSNPATNGGNAGTPGDGTDTEDFINDLNTGNYGGFSDWRMPTREELLSIVDYAIVHPSIDGTYFPNFMSSYYWSSTTNSGNTDRAWSIVFNYGSDNQFSYKSDSYSVYAVRAGQSVLESFDHLVINSDDTVTDSHTGLMWQKDGSPSTMNWESAIAYCENLVDAGYFDWRMPTEKELASIIKQDIFNPSIDTTYFTAMSSYYWTSTTYSGSNVYAWLIYFDSGYDHVYDKSDSYYVRAVRAGQSVLGSLDHLVISVPEQASFWEPGDIMGIFLD